MSRRASVPRGLACGAATVARFHTLKDGIDTVASRQARFRVRGGGWGWGVGDSQLDSMMGLLYTLLCVHWLCHGVHKNSVYQGESLN